ncbi:LytR family transcriptional regulator [Actinacidiphila oryziradicis]|uniref:LytR family transcriptional regulator n=1 Tax=Actinacidiphila oryziradicis TaxID=2571141 RepID=A0A4U0SK03_9ACTN|nr:LytR family transcriptional regulator [Actinacidiphila oryziradicis]
MGVLSAGVLLVAGAGWVCARLGGNIATFGAGGVSGDRPTSAAGQNVLVIGSDSRAGGNRSLGGGTGAVGRSDTTLLLHVYADQRHAVGVSVPRDALVDIPPCRLPDGRWSAPQQSVMFNSAFAVGLTASGNPACTQNTLEKLTGLRVDHTVVVEFEGFAAMTSALGGVPVCVPIDVYEKDLNPNRASRGRLLFRKGPQTVSGQKALDYVRLRHGIGDGSDIGRMKRQQAFLAGLIKKVKAQGFNPATLLSLADAATRSLTVDPGLGSAHKLLAFALSMKDINLHDITFVTAPWRYQSTRVALVHPAVDALWTALRTDHRLDSNGYETDDKAPSAAGPARSAAGAGINVAVYNGTTTPGLASRAAATLKTSGFTVTGTANARTPDHTTTVIEYGPGARPQATTVARLFAESRLRAVSRSGLTVILGRDYARRSPPTPAAEIGDRGRSADDNPCSNLSYG